MEPEEALTKQEVLDLYEQGVPTSDILNRAATRLGLDPAATMENMQLNELQLLQVLTPERGNVPAGEGEALRPQQVRLDMEALKGRPAREIANLAADLLGVNAENLRRSVEEGGEGLSDDQIISILVPPESVKMAPFGGFVESTARGAVRALPSLGAQFLTTAALAPSGPVIAGAGGMAASAAAIPVGQALEEAVFGPRVPLVPGQQFGGKVGDIVGAGLPFLAAPYAFTRGMSPQQLSVLSTRTGRDLTPAQSIAVQATTRGTQPLTSETLSLLAAGVGGATAGNMFPGSELAQVSGELAFGVLAPSQFLTEFASRAFGPLMRVGEAAIMRDPSRLSRRMVLKGPEGEERLLDLSRSVDRMAASTLRQAGWEQLPARDAGGFSPVMRMRAENSLSRVVANLMRDYQENPLQTARMLRAAANEPRGLNQLAAEYGIDLDVNLPVVGMVDSPVLRAIYATIQGSSEALGKTGATGRGQQLVRGLEGIEQIVRIMSQTGDPEDFADAMRLQNQLNETSINQMIDVNLARVTDAVAGLRQTDPNASQQASVAIANALTESLALARRQERLLYDSVDKSQPIELTNTLATARQIMSDLGITTETGDFDLSRIASTPLRTMLEVIDQSALSPSAVSALDEDSPMAALERMLAQEAQEFLGEGAGEADAAVSPTVRNALVLKRNLFDRTLAASSSANPDFGNAQYYGRLYDALMEDLGVSAQSVAARGGREALSENELALLNANSFSRALNDVFTRSFTGEALRKDPVGGYRIPPELLGQAALAGRGDNTALAMRDLANSVDLVLNNVRLSPEELTAATNRSDTLRANQETLLRVIASQTIDPMTGEFNLRQLRNLMSPNNSSGIAAALQRFPDLAEDLMNAESAQAVLRSVRDDTKQASRQSQDFLQAVLNLPPGQAVREAIGEPNNRPSDAQARLRGLIRIADQNGSNFREFARAGLLDTVLDQALVYSGRNTQNFSFEAMRDYLFTPVGRGRGESSTVAGILREQGLLNDQQLADLNTLLRDGQTVQRALAESRTDSELRTELAAVSPLRLGLLGRFFGAAEASRITNLLQLRQSIQAAGVGANVGEALFNKIPKTSLQDVVVKFLDDPEFAEIILRRSADLPELQGSRYVRMAQRLGRDLQASLVRNGLIVLGAGESERLQREGLPLPFVRPAQAATPDIAELEAYLQSVQQAAPAPATPAPPPGPTTATPSAGAPPPAVLPAAPPATQAGGQGRASYSALFPNDPIAPLVQQRELQQGIGSLVGPR
jgi:hypothetical protein